MPRIPISPLLAEPTVANHLARALAKLGIPNRMVLVRTYAALMDAG
jgi:DNA-binding CsgD family transcriptional regulator